MGKSDRENKSIPSKKEQPKVFSARRGERGWKLGRRSFLAGAAAAGVAVSRPKTLDKAEFQERTAVRAANSKFDFCHDPRAHGSTIDAFAMTTDGKFLATASSDKEVKLWELPLWRLDGALTGHQSGVQAIAISPNGKWLVCGDVQGNLYIWHLKKRKLVKEIEAYWSSSEGIVITPDSKRFATVGWETGDDAIKLWSLPKGKLLKQWGGTGSKHAIALSPDGKTLATDNFVGGKRITLWSMKKSEEGKEIKSFGDTGDMSSPRYLTFTPNGQLLIAAADLEDYLHIWTIPGGVLKKKFKPHDQFGVSAIAVDRKGKRLATGGVGLNEYVKIWALPSGKLQKTLGQGDDNFRINSALLFDPKQDFLYAAYTFAVRIWNAKKGKLLRCLIDIEDTLDTRRGRTYQYKAANGKTVTTTVPDCECAPKMPADAVCTCNTVRGKVKTGGGCGIVYYYPS